MPKPQCDHAKCASGPHQKRAAHALPFLHLRAGLFEIRDASDHTCGIKVGSATPKSQAGCDAGGDSKVFEPHAFTAAALGPALQSTLMKDSKASTATLLGRLEDFVADLDPTGSGMQCALDPAKSNFGPYRKCGNFHRGTLALGGPYQKWIGPHQNHRESANRAHSTGMTPPKAHSEK